MTRGTTTGSASRDTLAGTVAVMAMVCCLVHSTLPLNTAAGPGPIPSPAVIMVTTRGAAVSESLRPMRLWGRCASPPCGLCLWHEARQICQPTARCGRAVTPQDAAWLKSRVGTEARCGKDSATASLLSAAERAEHNGRAVHISRLCLQLNSGRRLDRECPDRKGSNYTGPDRDRRPVLFKDSVAIVTE
jgi:hypothetical protein